ncbi:MAG: NAD(P)H-hydrate dehydratase [Elusimicrobiota bacterium]
MKNLTTALIKKLIQARPANSHKGNFGHTLIVASSTQYTGAAILCSLGCIRSGSGLTTLAFPESLYESITKRLPPEIMTLPIPDKEGSISLKATEVLVDFIADRKISSVAFGCGISTDKKTRIFTANFLLKNKSPIVIDADGLNNIQKNLKVLKKTKSYKIVTPHPGELSRLTDIPINKIQNNREKIAKKFAQEYNLICVLKGYETVITDGEEIFINTTGNPGMAVGGSGDVLTGMIAAFIGQTRSLIDAACLGVYLHGLAGDLAAKEKTQISMLPSDLVEKIPEAVRTVLKF